MDRARCKNVRAWQCLLMSSSDSMWCGGPPLESIAGTSVPWYQEIQNRGAPRWANAGVPASVRNAMLSAIAPRRKSAGVIAVNERMVPCSRMQSTRRNPRSLGKGCEASSSRYVRLRHRVRRLECAHPLCTPRTRGRSELTGADISGHHVSDRTALRRVLCRDVSCVAGRRLYYGGCDDVAMPGCFPFLRATSMIVARERCRASCGLAMSAVSALVVVFSVGALHEGSGWRWPVAARLLGVMAGSLAVGFLVLSHPTARVDPMDPDRVAGAGRDPQSGGAPENGRQPRAAEPPAKPVIGVDAKLRSVLPIAACAYVAFVGRGHVLPIRSARR